MAEPLPLEGVKVVDFTWAIAGPMTTKYLALYGAQVVKVESHSRVDSVRLGPPFMGKPSRNSGAMFANMSSSKMSISLNLKLPQAMEVVKRLVQWADIAVENFSAGQMAEWGLDYERLREINPRLIMLSSSQQGQTGPHAPHPGLGNLLQGLVGITHLTGYPDRRPQSPQLPLPDLIAPWFSLAAILAALEYRDRTGKGQYLDLSQLEASLQFVAPALLDYFVNGREGGRRGNFSDEAAPHNAYRCASPSTEPALSPPKAPADRWCAISVRSQEEWVAFCRVLGDPPWTREPRFATHLARLRNVEELDRLVTEWTSQHPAEEVMRLTQEAGVPAGIVANGRDLHEDPQLQGRKHFHILEHPGRGSLSYDGPAFRISGVEPDVRPAPDLGQHTEAVCRQLLGFSEADYQALGQQGVFG